MLIVIEGLDGAGKRTLTGGLHAALTAAGRSVATGAFGRPWSTAWGEREARRTDLTAGAVSAVRTTETRPMPGRAESAASAASRTGA